MQRVPSELDIDGHVVHLGSTVQVKWLGVWYEGVVVKMGPKRNLYRVKDVLTGEVVVLEKHCLKFLETHLMERQMLRGTHVAYNDGDQWSEGVVKSNSVVGVVLVSWRKSALGEKNLTWFELSDVAPVIHNEAYEEHNRDTLEASKSGLLQLDTIEPHPRTTENMLYESGSDSENELTFQMKLPSTSKVKGYSRDNHKKRSLKYEAVPENKEKDNESVLLYPPPPLPPHFPFPQVPGYSPFPPMPPPMMHPFPHMALPYQNGQFMRISPSFMSARSFRTPMQHPRQIKKPGLSHASVPCVMSYNKHTNGIPPHSSSRFFQKLQGKISRYPKLSFQSQGQMKKSPTLESQIQSEPIPYMETYPMRSPNRASPLHQNQPDGFPAPTMPAPISPSHIPSHSKQPKPSRNDPHTTRTNLSPSHSLPPNRAPSSPHHHIQQNISAPGKSKSLQHHHKLQPPPLPPRPYEIVRPRAPQPGGQNKKSHRREHILSAPQVMSVSPTHVAVTQGGSTLLTCVVKSSDPLHYEWKKDNTKIPEDVPFYTQPAPGMLQIQKACQEHSGMYTCTATNRNGAVQRWFQLKVTEDMVPRVTNQTTAQPQFNSKVTHDELTMNSIYEEVFHHDREEQPTTHPSTSQPPVIIVQQPPSDPSTPVMGTEKYRPHLTEDAAKGNDEGIDEDRKEEENKKSRKRNRRRVSTVLKNDMESYLEGYGEDYGAMSSKINLQLEPCLEGEEDEEDTGEVRRQGQKLNKRKKKMKKTKKCRSQGSGSPAKSIETLQNLGSLKKTQKFVSLPKLSSSLLKKKKKGVRAVAPEQIAMDPIQTRAWQQSSEKARESTYTAGTSEEEVNSVAVHTSLGGTSASEISLVKGREEKDDGEGEGLDSSTLELPAEEETLNDSVRRLQLSVQEFGPDQMHLKQDKKKGFLSSMFSSKGK